MSDTKEVYKAINAVQTDLAKTGITKDSENTFDHYKFRGIDAVYNALSPLLAKHGLCVLPRFTSRACEERTSKSGGAMFYVTVEGEFDFVSAKDSSCHTVRTFGEAMDRSDKATNKAMSAAYKYAAFQTFAIPTEGDNDTDATTPDVEPALPKPDIVRDMTEIAAEMCMTKADLKDWAMHLHNKPFTKLDGKAQEAMLHELKQKCATWKAIGNYIDTLEGDVPDGLPEAERVDRTIAFITEHAAGGAFDGKPLRVPLGTWLKWTKELNDKVNQQKVKA